MSRQMSKAEYREWFYRTRDDLVAQVLAQGWGEVVDGPFKLRTEYTNGNLVTKIYQDGRVVEEFRN